MRAPRHNQLGGDGLLGTRMASAHTCASPNSLGGATLSSASQHSGAGYDASSQLAGGSTFYFVNFTCNELLGVTAARRRQQHASSHQSGGANARSPA